MKFKCFPTFLLAIFCAASVTANAEWEWEITTLCNADKIERIDNAFTALKVYYSMGKGGSAYEHYNAADTYYYDGNTMVLKDDNETASAVIIPQKTTRFAAPARRQFSEYDRISVYSNKNKAVIIQKDGKYGFTDLDLNEIVPPVYDKAYIDDGYCLGICLQDDTYYTDIYDCTGNKLGSIEGEYTFSNVGMGLKVSEKTGKYALVSADWKVITDFIFDQPYESGKTDNYGAACMSVNGKLGLVSAAGEFLTEFIYKSITPEPINTETGDDVCFVCAGENGTDYLNSEFKPFNFEKGVLFPKHTAVRKADRVVSNIGDMYALINTATNEYIIPYGKCYEITYNFNHNNFCAVYKDGESYKTDLTDPDGNVLFTVNGRADNMDIERDGLRTVEYKHNVRIIDGYGENIFPNEYWDVYKIDRDNYVVLTQNRTMQYFKHVTTAVHTDVMTKINGVEIPCFSVNSRAVITAEDLRGYGFDVIWNIEKRRLDITRNPDYREINPVPIPPKSTSGSFYDNISETDIKVYFNGKEINAFAINGVMLIKPEDIEYGGISFDYSDEERTLYMTVDGLN